MAATDKIWLENALQASDYVMRDRLRLPAEVRPTILVFDSRCRFEAKGAKPADWVATPHQGKIRLPDGHEVDAGVTSFAPGRCAKPGAARTVRALFSLQLCATGRRDG